MGIKDFYKYVKNTFPECFVPVHYTDFRYKKMAIDMMNVLYIYRSRLDTEWMGSVIRFLNHLRKMNIHPICVFDGKSHPLKLSTIQKRKDTRNRGKEKFEQLHLDLEQYKQTQEITPNLQEFIDKNPDYVSALSGKIMTEQIELYFIKQQRVYNLHFEHSEIETLKTIIQAMGICVLTADYDGEHLCSLLSMQNQTDIVLSNDSDVFFFGCKKVITKFNDQGGFLVELDIVLEKLGLAFESFMDLCIICGTDFNENIRGIGFIKGLELVRKYKSIDNPEFPYQDWIQTQNISKVKQMLVESNVFHTFYSKQPQDLNELNMILFKNNIPISIQEFNYNPSIIEFEG
jgi:5'-3' exonuclease